MCYSRIKCIHAHISAASIELQVPKYVAIENKKRARAFHYLGPTSRWRMTRYIFRLAVCSPEVLYKFGSCRSNSGFEEPSSADFF